MPTAPFVKAIATAKYAMLTAALSLGALLPSTLAWAQQRQMMPEEMRQLEMSMAQFETTAVWIQLGMNVLFLVVFGGILLYARGNMKGWNQPLKEVWFSFSGRLNRKAYWLKGVMLMSMIGIGVQIFALLMAMMMGANVLSALGGIMALIVILPLLVFNTWVGLAVTIKRFHDLGSSGWWVLGFFIPFYNFWLMIKLAFFPGTPGPNAFGPDPIDAVADYIDKMTGGDDDEDGDEQAPTQPQPKPRAPQGGPGDGAAPQGFGAKKFTRPTVPVAPEAKPEENVSPEMPGGSANLDVIKRRLGDDILRPIKRKGGGGRDPMG